MNKSMVFDIGMHSGRDTEFYLLKGFDVIAVEANPRLALNARSYFADAIAKKRLILYEEAIAAHEGTIRFYINEDHDDWGTTAKAFAERNELLGTNNTSLDVKCRTFLSILREHGVPYYLKIDIEGADILCLRDLLSFGESPKYLSIEVSLTSFEEFFTELSLMWMLGYRHFKIVNQAANRRIKCCNPPLEGVFVNYHFDGFSSGPFGEEAPGQWMSVEAVITIYRRLLTEQKYFGAGRRLYKTPIHGIYQMLKRQPVGWYDIHAKLGES
jgi:FkbM family methyltransferase